MCGNENIGNDNLAEYVEHISSAGFSVVSTTVGKITSSAPYGHNFSSLSLEGIGEAARLEERQRVLTRRSQLQERCGTALAVLEIGKSADVVQVPSLVDSQHGLPGDVAVLNASPPNGVFMVVADCIPGY